MNSKKVKALRKSLKSSPLPAETGYISGVKFYKGEPIRLHGTLQITDSCRRGAYQRIKKSLKNHV